MLQLIQIHSEDVSWFHTYCSLCIFWTQDYAGTFGDIPKTLVTNQVILQDKDVSFLTILARRFCYPNSIVIALQKVQGAHICYCV